MADEFELEVLARMPNYNRWIMDTFTPFVRGHVIEYGAGSGTISEQLTSLADKLTLVEPLADLAAILQTKFGPEFKVEVLRESLERHTARTGADTADTVVMVNVLEHIEDDRGALTQLFRILRPRGCLLVFVPALQALMSKIDVRFGHFRRYHRTDLIRKVAEAGGKIQLCRYFDLLGVAPWFFINKLMGATTFNPGLVRIHDRFVVPVSRALDHIISMPVGKNIILVARKQ